MNNCEIYSVLKNQADTKALDDKLDEIASTLYDKDIRVVYNTTIKPDAKAISKALYHSAESADAPTYNIFLNALDTEGSESFKELFAAFIKSHEERITPNEENKDKVAKIRISSLGDLSNGYKGYCFQIFDKRYIALPLASLCETEISYLVANAIEKAEEIFKKNEESSPDGLVFVEPKVAVKESFLMSFIPNKNNSKSTKIRKWIVLFALLIFVVAAGFLVNELFIKPAINNKTISEIQNIAYSHRTGDSGKPDDPNAPKQNWEALKNVNKEIVGWLTINNTRIDHPVLYHKGDSNSSQYYLYRNYKKESSSFGSVFIDYRSDKAADSRNVVIHGHNTRDGSMFSDLLKYTSHLRGNLDFYKKSPTIEFNTPKGDNTYKIIAVIKTSTLFEHGYFFNFQQGSFLSDAEFMNFVYNVRERSLIDCPVDVNEKDQLITLSTCSYEFKNFRTVIVARKLRDGESATVDTKKAALNPNPYFPDVYYERYGGSRPRLTTFKTEYNRGAIKWYDGKGNLSGSEELSATIAANPKKDENGNFIIDKSEYAYQVRFLNHDGSEYKTYTVKHGKSVSLPSGKPKIPADDENFDYEFTGWNTKGLNLKSVTSSMTIKPNFKATPKAQTQEPTTSNPTPTEAETSEVAPQSDTSQNTP